MSAGVPASAAELWERLASVAPMMLRALLADMRVVRLTSTEAELSCAPHARAVAEKKLDDLSRLLSELSGKQIRARLVEGAHEPAAGAPAESPQQAAPPPDLDHPIVKKTLELFNGRIIDVKPMRSKPNENPGEI